ncbi:MAG TPA: hypothetical protein VF828_04840 [Patescibacteria group bacterium]
MSDRERPIFNRQLQILVDSEAQRVSPSQKWREIKRMEGTRNYFVWVKNSVIAYTEGSFPKDGTGSVEWTNSQFEAWRENYCQDNGYPLDAFPYSVEVRTSENVPNGENGLTKIAVLCLKPDDKKYRNADNVSLNNISTTAQAVAEYIEAKKLLEWEEEIINNEIMRQSWGELKQKERESQNQIKDRKVWKLAGAVIDVEGIVPEKTLEYLKNKFNEWMETSGTAKDEFELAIEQQEPVWDNARGLVKERRTRVYVEPKKDEIKGIQVLAVAALFRDFTKEVL